MGKNLLVILTFMAIGYSGCKQVEYVAPPPAAATSYFPQTYGSTWTYRDSLFGEPTDTVGIRSAVINSKTFTINGSTTDFNGLICYNARVVDQNNAVGTAYYYVGKHVFALLESTPPAGFLILNIMVDTAAVGHVWVSSPALNTLLNGSPAQAVNTVVEKDLTRTVNGVTFTNVIHTTTSLQTNIKGEGFQNIANFDFYLAPGVGLIEKDAFYYGQLNEVETLESFNITR